MTADTRSGYTSHGHWYGPGEPTEPKPIVVVRCGGPGMCRGCRKEAGLHTHPRPFSRETDLERVIRADERRRVAEEIARECATKAAYFVAVSDEIEYGLNIADGLRDAAEIARNHREVRE